MTEEEKKEVLAQMAKMQADCTRDLLGYLIFITIINITCVLLWYFLSNLHP